MCNRGDSSNKYLICKKNVLLIKKISLELKGSRDIFAFYLIYLSANWYICFPAIKKAPVA